MPGGTFIDNCRCRNNNIADYDILGYGARKKIFFFFFAISVSNTIAAYGAPTTGPVSEIPAVDGLAGYSRLVNSF